MPSAHEAPGRIHEELPIPMSENNEDVGIELGVDADAALDTLQQLSAAAKAADTDIQALKEQLNTLTSRVTTGATTPEIAQTRQALNARRAEVQGQAMDFVGANPQVVTQPLPDTLAQFQDAMAQREQQQQAQQQRQAQQQAAGIERPARYGYDQSAPPAPSHASFAPITATTVPTMQATGTTTMAPLATTGDERLVQALTTASAPTRVTTSDAPARGGDTDGPPGAPSSASVDTQLSAMRPVASLATTGNAPTGDLPGDLQRLVGAALSADEGIKRLRERLMEQVNTQMGAAGIRPQTFEQAQDLLERHSSNQHWRETPVILSRSATSAGILHASLTLTMARMTGLLDGVKSDTDRTFDYLNGALGRMPPADLAAAAPDVVVTQQRIAVRSAEVTGQVTDFAGQNPQATGQPISQLLDELKAFVQQQQASTASGASSAPSAGGAGSGADTSAVARYGLLPATPSPMASTDATQTDRFASTMGERLASSIVRSGAGFVAGGIQGAANAAGMGATGDVLAGLARPLMAMFGEFAAPLAAAAVVGAGVLAVNGQQAHYAQEQQGLSGAVGTLTGATPLSELRTVQNVGWNYLYGEKDSIAAANQLGQAGVLSNQMPGALNDAMALSRISGLDLGQTTDLTGGLMKAGASSTQVGDTYAALDEAARHSGVSLDRLVKSLQTLQQAAGASQLDVNGLAAAQKLAGSNVQVGQALAPLVGATAGDAMQQMAMLGLNPAQFAQAQAHPQVAWDAYSRLAKQYDVGTYGTQTAESALQAAGLDMSGLSGQAASPLVQKLVSQGPRAAEDYAASLDKQSKTGAGPHNAGDLYKQGVDAAQRISSFLQQAEIHAEKIAADLLLAEHSASAPLAALTSQQQEQIIADARKRGAEAQLALVQHAPSAAVRAARLLGYEAITSGQDYANDPNAAGGIDASKGVGFGPVSEYQMAQYRQSGLYLGGGPGKGPFVSPDVLRADEVAARRTGVPIAELLSQDAKEATVNGTVDPLAGTGPGHGGNLPGLGLGQWTPGPHNENLPTIEKYLGAASKDMGLGPVTASNWRQAAINPRISALGTGLYDRDLYAHSGEKWAKALAPYNGTGPQAQAYGLDVNANAQKIEIQLGGSIDITQGGVKVGTGQVGTHIQARTSPTHSIDTSRKHVGAQSYGPDQRPPSPGLPTMPGHIGGPLRR